MISWTAIVRLACNGVIADNKILTYLHQPSCKLSLLDSGDPTLQVAIFCFSHCAAEWIQRQAARHSHFIFYFENT
jgi:hypothetical protein